MECTRLLSFQNDGIGLKMFDEQDLVRCSHRIGQDDLRQPILVAGVGIGNVGLGFLEFRLAEFHDGTEAEVVSGLREIEREIGLLAELPGDRKALEAEVARLWEWLTATTT